MRMCRSRIVAVINAGLKIWKMIFEIDMPLPVWDKNVLQPNRRGQERRAQVMECGGFEVVDGVACSI
jgi:hypothetical protein